MPVIYKGMQSRLATKQSKKPLYPQVILTEKVPPITQPQN
ncbi:MAG: hypothetical protein H6Q13_2581 [Bacteroidetes bacterium]|nr:hypothetical protein [Bacteroidota bacterium]